MTVLKVLVSFWDDQVFLFGWGGGGGALYILHEAVSYRQHWICLTLHERWVK